MRILFLTSRIPYPPYRGDKLRAWNLIKYLGTRHEITLLSFIQDRSEISFVSALQPYCARVEVVYLPSWRSVFNCLVGIFTSLPLQVSYFRSKRMSRALESLLQEVNPDIIHTHLIRMAQYTHSLDNNGHVLDLTDAISLYLRRLRDGSKNRLVRLAAHFELSRMVEYERLIPEYDRAVVCSPIDRQFLLQHIPEARIDLVPNGIDLDFFSIEGDLQPDPYRIVFAGNMSYFPNTDGAVFLIEEIFPHIKKSVPEAKIYIVGQNPPRRIKALAREDVVVTGFVSDIRSAYLRGSVAVSPIRFGAGTPNKVLEPLALGIPVVSTAIGVEGLDLQAGKEIFIASSPEEFAGHVIRLLTDSELRKEVGRAARSAVMKQYDIKTTAQELERIYIQISQQT